MKYLFILLSIIAANNVGFSQIKNLHLEVQTSKSLNKIECRGTIKLLDTVDTLSWFAYDFNHLGLCRYKMNFSKIERKSSMYDFLAIEDEKGNYYSPIDFMPKSELQKLEQYECEFDISVMIITKDYFHELIEVSFSNKKLEAKNISKFRLCYVTLSEDDGVENYLLKSNWLVI